MSFFRNFVFNFYDKVSENSFEEFNRLMFFKSFSKDHKLVDLNQTPTNFYILKSGVVRSFLVDEKGKEYTKTIFVPITTTGNLGALITNTPSNLIYECLTDCEVLECSYQSFYNLSLKHHDLSIFHYKVLEHIYMREEAKILELSILDASQRYEKLKNRLPNIDNLINQYHIASYLNITPVQLSRIKKNSYK
ncbi:Crp/Fnr family transcriptional regulator [Tenacibaculum aiptasiae]|uniref:Crp/Fnr family transcriptional regulator n=1 Tax=Tenacibaculum aiptasiae TaxID=426481 RepID=A0A7J5AAU3_9FLAO|nr:Crp/Fnr family transcriptional regulator [Tenacibaculum aiptasiae]KAB1154684.1 Crp/Fnr family transcriptional regulator [Tenacibaculum aiptasiae]